MNRSRESIASRRNQLLSLIYQNGEMSVAAMGKRLQATEITVRRDLAYLSDMHLIERFHGGARAIDRVLPKEEVLKKKRKQHLMEKRVIAQKTVEFLSDGDTVFINSGSTALEVLKAMQNLRVQVVSNNALAPACMPSSETKLLSTGGELHTQSMSFIGEFATGVLDRVVANRCILGVNGISVENGVTTTVYQHAVINDTMVRRCSGPVIVVADSSKIGRTCPFLSTKLETISTLVTDSGINPEELEKLRNAGLQVIVVEPH